MNIMVGHVKDTNWIWGHDPPGHYKNESEDY